MRASSAISRKPNAKISRARRKRVKESTAEGRESTARRGVVAADVRRRIMLPIMLRLVTSSATVQANSQLSTLNPPVTNWDILQSCVSVLENPHRLPDEDSDYSPKKILCNDPYQIFFI